MSKIALTPNASGTGVFTISSPATNTDRTLTLPDEAGTVLTSASSLASANLTGAVTVSGSNVGIGTSSPTAALDTYGIIKTTNTADNSYYGTFSNPDGITRIQALGGGASIAMSTASTERLRIDSSGNVDIGGVGEPHITGNMTRITQLGTIFSARNGSAPLILYRQNSDAGGIVAFNYNTTQVGVITVNSNSTSYGTSSDYRLKTDAQPMTGASARVQALNPVNFAWIVDGTRVDGFLAHEAQAVVPECVTGTKDGMEDYEITPAVLDDDGNVTTEAVMGTRPVMQGIDQSKLVPLLTAALQEALNKIEAMETRLAALEAV
jgi:hypothetical protein